MPVIVVQRHDVRAKTDQETGSLEEGDARGPAAILAFLGRARD